MASSSASFVELLRQARQGHDYGPLTALIPSARLFRIGLEAAEGHARCRMTYAPELVGFQSLHGGALGALLESSALFELLLQEDTERMPRLISLTTEFLRAGGLQDTFAQGFVTRQGRRVANVRVEAWQQERSRLIATAHATFLMVP
ncbi:PaaI family thioesterase [Hyalangium rubrum]|uniref:PaaI family thioesterase n=1 Tax=Hyalangium rubrum TaxID=3103134 RepID=A0ABU5H2U5_9BACT|nr:PaaI family thioesterase [Hyalangium sp. s54d21]MDY7227764.1 PaaI family thioesterase [Hyalangium sp. s54d21]